VESAQAAANELDEASENITLPALTVISHTAEWSKRTEWAWLEGETGLEVCWPSVEKLAPLLDAMPRREICVQAGGALGVFPAYLANRFGLVLTFEPNPSSFRCLVHNVSEHVNVTCMQGALSDQAGFAELICPPGYSHNAGAWYIKPSDTSGAVMRVRLDDLKLPALDLLLLDVEGHELFALMGAWQTIKLHRPLIVLEDKEKCRRQAGVPAGWLDTFCKEVGYSRHGNIHADQLLVPI
jgi:FkbM family methyltransferase